MHAYTDDDCTKVLVIRLDERETMNLHLLLALDGNKAPDLAEFREKLDRIAVQAITDAADRGRRVPHAR